MSKRIVFTATESLAERIDEEAEELGLNRSEVIRNHVARSIED